MNSTVRTYAVPACVVAIGAMWIVWNLETTRAAKRKLETEAQQYRVRADHGDANAEYELGRAYLWGLGVPQDYAQANSWFQNAADQGQAKAMYSIGNLYYYGDGVAQSYADALVWYRKAADQGLYVAQFAIAASYYHGFGVPQSYSEAMVWYRKAADQGYAKAETGIGYLYWAGLGVPKDHKEANLWYRRAANHGDEDAQRWLGLRLSPLRPWVWITQSFFAVGGLLLTSGFFSPKRPLHDQNDRRLAVGGLLAFSGIAMFLFEHSKYCLFPSPWLAEAFQSGTLFLGGVAITLLATAFRPRAGKALLIFAGILFVVIDLTFCVIAHFNLQVLSASIWRLFAIDASPLGIAISAAVHLWRMPKGGPVNSTNPPAENGETPSAL